MTDNNENHILHHEKEVLTKVYRKRWLILLIYILYTIGNSYQWLEYPIVANIVAKYYNVTYTAVDWTSIIYMVIYPFAVIPVSYIVDNKGLRVAALYGGLGTALSAFVKLLSVKRDVFYVVLIGQAIGSTAQVFVLCLPAKIASVWFKPEEASITCALGVYGVQLGLAFGYILPTLVVKDHEDINHIGSDLNWMCWQLALYMIPVSLAIIFCFPSQPDLPPSITQLELRKRRPPTFPEFWESFKHVFAMKGFLAHTVAFGINTGAYVAFGTLLNQFILPYFPNCVEDAGRLGLLTIVAAMIGSAIYGYYLDKYHRYKETTLFLYYMYFLGLLAFLISLMMKHKVLVYISSILIGLFGMGYLSVAFELAVELTFPSDETTTVGILNTVTQVFGALFVIALGPVNENMGPVATLSILCGFLFIGSLLTQTVPNVKKRQEAFRKDKEQVELKSLTSKDVSTLQ